MSFETSSFMPFMRVMVRSGRRTRTVLGAEGHPREGSQGMGLWCRDWTEAGAPEDREVLHLTDVLEQAERHHDKVETADGKHDTKESSRIQNTQRLCFDESHFGREALTRRREGRRTCSTCPADKSPPPQRTPEPRS